MEMKVNDSKFIVEKKEHYIVIIVSDKEDFFLENIELPENCIVTQNREEALRFIKKREELLSAEKLKRSIEDLEILRQKLSFVRGDDPDPEETFHIKRKPDVKHQYCGKILPKKVNNKLFKIPYFFLRSNNRCPERNFYKVKK